MTRVVSLYLPHWAIDRVRRAERRRAPPRPDIAAADLAPLAEAAAGEQARHCDAPRNTGWRPGARWARADGTGTGAGIGRAGDKPWSQSTREDVARQVEALPAHQRPPMREMGRRSEAADHPFRAMPPDEAARPVRTTLPLSPDPKDKAGKRAGGYPKLDPNADDRAAETLVRRRAAHTVTQGNAMPNVRNPGDGPLSDPQARRGSNEAGAPLPGVAAFFDTGRTTANILTQVCAPTVVHLPAPVRAPIADRLPVSAGQSGPAAAALARVARSRDTVQVRQGIQGSARLESTRLGSTSDDSTRHASAQLDTARLEPVRHASAGAGPVPRPRSGRTKVVETRPPPLVTVQKTGSRVEIAAASAEARALGLAPGMALTQARALVPELDVRDADPDGDRADLTRLATTLARRWCPVVSIADDATVFLDISGTAHLHGGEAAFANRLRRLLARLGITAQLAIADTAGAAWALARQAEGEPLIVPPEAHRDALATLPVAALRIDETKRELLARLGVDTIGALAAMPRAPLVRRFGTTIARRLDQATGAAPEPLDPIVPAQPIAVTRRFAEPIATADAIAHWLAGLVTELTVELAKAGLGARALAFVAARVDSTDQVIRVGLARATRDPAHLLRLIARRIEEIDVGYGIDALTLHLVRADPLGPEALGATLAEQPAPDLAPLVDTLANRIGAARLWRHQPVESDVPERSVAPLAPLDPPATGLVRLKLDDVRQLDRRTPDHPWHARWPRPTRLLRRPELVDHIMAELPDHAPRRFTWRGRPHIVIHADGPERITGEWWRRSGERTAVRDYFRVEDSDGRRFWLFRRGDGLRAETGDHRWYVHGTFA